MGMYELYDDQHDLVDRTYAEFKKGNRSVLLRAETGCGKTVIAGEIITRATIKKSLTWFVVPRKELLRQTSNAFNDFDLNHSYIASGKVFMPSKYLYICSLRTLISRIETVQIKPKLVMIDEGHYSEKEVGKVVEYCKKHKIHLIILTATPQLSSGQGFKKWCDAMVNGLQIKELQELGRLNSYRFFPPRRKSSYSGVKVVGDDYKTAEIEQALWLDEGRITDITGVYKEHCTGYKTLIFGVSIKDCEKIKEGFTADGIRSDVIHAKVKDSDRIRMINDFANGLTVLINCDLCTFGFDLSAQVGRKVTVEALIDAAPTKSLVKQRQKNGRALRCWDKLSIIIDLVGNYLEHGLPCDDKEWSLDDWKDFKSGSKKPSTYKVRVCDNGWDRLPHQPPCWFTHKVGPICPNCGFVYPVDAREIEDVDGDVVEVDIEEFKALQQDWKKTRRMEVGKCKTESEIRAIAKERKYKEGWIRNQCKLKRIPYKGYR